MFSVPNPMDLVYLGFFTAMIFSTTLWMIVYFFNREWVHDSPEPTSYPEITFLVPAFNEEDTVAGTIDALRSLEYPSEKLSIIAINDGSTDGTLAELQRYADTIEIIDKPNGGKASALNAGLERVKTTWVACMDADSYPEPDFLQNMVGWLDHDGVKGVTPALKVREPETWVQKIIWTEYIFQIFLRKMFAIFDVQYVLPGPGSIYHTETLRELGGWDEHTFTEDMEVAFRMFAHGARLQNSATAFVDTVSPPTLKGLFRQRIRWYRGYIENFLTYRHMLGRRQYGNLGVFILPFNILWLIIIVVTVAHLGWNIIDSMVSAAQQYLLVGTQPFVISFGLQNLHLFHVFFAFFVLTGIGTILLSLKTAHEELNLWDRKVHYATFLTIYPILFGLFWIATFAEELFRHGDRTW